MRCISIRTVPSLFAAFLAVLNICERAVFLLVQFQNSFLMIEQIMFVTIVPGGLYTLLPFKRVKSCNFKENEKQLTEMLKLLHDITKYKIKNCPVPSF